MCFGKIQMKCLLKLFTVTKSKLYALIIIKFQHFSFFDNVVKNGW